MDQRRERGRERAGGRERGRERAKWRERERERVEREQKGGRERGRERERESERERDGEMRREREKWPLSENSATSLSWSMPLCCCRHTKTAHASLSSIPPSPPLPPSLCASPLCDPPLWILFSLSLSQLLIKRFLSLILFLFRFSRSL